MTNYCVPTAIKETRSGRVDLDDIELLEEQAAKVELSPEDQDKVPGLVEAIWQFVVFFSGKRLYWYQELFGKRIIESVITADGDEITALFSRQSGKTETLTDVTCGLMILLPRLAKVPEFEKMLADFKDGFTVGVFAPVKDQADTLYSRIIARFTAARAKEILSDPEIDEPSPKPKGDTYQLKRCKSQVTMMSAHARANIESKTYHLIVIDEAQKADEEVVTKSISPMGAHTGATMVLTGTPDRVKGYFYGAIQRNIDSDTMGESDGSGRRHMSRRARKRNHYQFDWRACAKERPKYAQYVMREMARHGKDSEYFRMSYGCEWLLDRGMFVTAERMDMLAEPQLEVKEVFTRHPCLIGIDVAKEIDSTVVTVVRPLWDDVNENRLAPHVVLNWLELQGEFEAQYSQVYQFLRNYWVHGIGVDGNGMGTGWPERLSIMFPHAHIVALSASQKAQDLRFTYLQSLLQGSGPRGPLLRWPKGPQTQRLRTTRRFYQQMINAEKVYTNQGYLTVGSPKGTNQHDDYVDSLANACVLSKLLEEDASEVEVSQNFLFRSKLKAR